MKVYYKHYRVPASTKIGNKGATSPLEYRRYYKNKYNFVPGPKGGATEMFVRFDSGRQYRVMTHCSRSEVFSYAEGRRQAEIKFLNELFTDLDNAVYDEAGEVSMTMSKDTAVTIGHAINTALSDPRLSKVFREKLRLAVFDVNFTDFTD